MAYKQWIGIKNRSRLRKGDLRIKHAKLQSGKFYEGNKDNEISASDVDKIVIAPQSQGTVYSCGRSDAAIGTEGEYTLYDWDGEHETKICRIYWSAPWGAHPNIFQIRDWDPNTSDYVIHKDDVQQDSTIGNVELVVAKLA
ncbi:aegerolysin type hemolysin [Apiospora sp. TS-2023a]|uniref:Aegerolysin type hemolysin n=1 Tax=Apiospora saccharicola TaxID=335842 RepID=A0ABR1UYT3_9PEZI